MSDVRLLHGEPLMLTAEEWSRVADLPPEPPSGPAEYCEGLADVSASRKRGDPVMTHEQYLSGRAP
jgi:hypothetical protein